MVPWVVSAVKSGASSLMRSDMILLLCKVDVSSGDIFVQPQSIAGCFFWCQRSRPRAKGALSSTAHDRYSAAAIFALGDKRPSARSNFSLAIANLSTVRYLGIEVDDALEIAEQTEV